MDQNAMLKQMIDYHQMTFNSVFNTTAMLQDQFEHAAVSVLDQAAWIPEDGREALAGWMGAVKAGRDHYKQYMDATYRKAHDYIAA